MNTEPNSLPYQQTPLEAKWNSVNWRPGLPLPPVNTSCEVAGANTDLSCDQDRAFSEVVVVGYSPCGEFVCFQKPGNWPFVERLQNCWFRPGAITAWNTRATAPAPASGWMELARKEVDSALSYLPQEFVIQHDDPFAAMALTFAKLAHAVRTRAPDVAKLEAEAKWLEDASDVLAQRCGFPIVEDRVQSLETVGNLVERLRRELAEMTTDRDMTCCDVADRDRKIAKLEVEVAEMKQSLAGETAAGKNYRGQIQRALTEARAEMLHPDIGAPARKPMMPSERILWLGQRIAALEAENARLRDLLKKVHDKMLNWFSSEYAEHPDTQEVTAALAASPAPSAWREMDSAPKDGTEVLILIPGNDKPIIRVAYFDNEEWLDPTEGDPWCDPTHWQSLPEPPAREEAK